MDIQSVIDQIASKAGISKDQAKTAFTATVDFLKSKLPSGVGQQLSSLAEGKELNLEEGAKMMKDKFF